jgi:hypothetical protein
MIFRTAEQKADLRGSFERPDRPFFAAGACHVLAHAFLETNPSAGFEAVHIKPRPGFRGTHIVAASDALVFDYHGFTERDRFFRHLFSKMGRFLPGWDADLVPIKASAISKEWCEANSHRMPHQFFKDPLPRAFAFARRFPPPPV